MKDRGQGRRGLAQNPGKARRIVALATLLGLSGAALAAAEACRPAAEAAPAGCPDGTIAVGGACVCGPGLLPLAAGCITQTFAESACGPSSALAALPEGGAACREILCNPGEAFDSLQGRCVTPAELRQLPEVAWLGLRTSERFTCPEAGPLETANGKIGCRPREVCRFGRSWDGARCVIPALCQAGQLPDDGGCAPVVRRRTVDLAAWVRLALDEPSLCSLAPPATEASFRVVVDAPGNDVSQVSLSVSGTELAIPAIRPVLEARLEGLRSLGGSATTSRAERTVTCPPRNLASAAVEPIDGGEGK